MPRVKTLWDKLQEGLIIQKKQESKGIASVYRKLRGIKVVSNFGRKTIYVGVLKGGKWYNFKRQAKQVVIHKGVITLLHNDNSTTHYENYDKLYMRYSNDTGLHSIKM